MGEPIEVKVQQLPEGGSVFMAKFDDSAIATLSNNGVIAIIQEIVRAVADRYVTEHYGEIVSKIDQQAIANLAIAESGKKIAEAITAKPTILHDTKTEVKTEVYERGIFGGTRRVR